MAKFICNDSNAELEIEADTAQEAAQEYVDSASWGEIESTIWIDVYVRRAGEDEDSRELITIAIDPQAPKCAGGRADPHFWISPHWLVGGIKENPGCWGHGGGVVYVEACRHCGCKMTTDTWAQRPDTGEQGLRSVRYEPGVFADALRERGILSTTEEAL